MLTASRSRSAPTSERVVQDVAQPNYLSSLRLKALGFGQTVRNRVACHHDANGISVHQPTADAPRLPAPTSALSSRPFPLRSKNSALSSIPPHSSLAIPARISGGSWLLANNLSPLILRQFAKLHNSVNSSEILHQLGRPPENQQRPKVLDFE